MTKWRQQIKWLGFLLILLGGYSLEQGEYTFKDIAIFGLGILMVCGKPLFDHLFFIEREKVRAQYRSKR